jgi:N-acyl-D-aspartate/D-glutamate deacylase
MADFDPIVRNGSIHDGLGNPPFAADVAIKDGLIAAIGTISGRGHEKIEARGQLVTPGFVDIHSHCDGQVMREHRIAPSSGHGVTSVVMGNCGVGFALCEPEQRDILVKLMEGVEDIPEVESGTIVDHFMFDDAGKITNVRAFYKYDCGPGNAQNIQELSP